jgi:hypothetical protein
MPGPTNVQTPGAGVPARARPEMRPCLAFGHGKRTLPEGPFKPKFRNRNRRFRRSHRFLRELSGMSLRIFSWQNTQGIDIRNLLYPCNLCDLRLNPFSVFGFKHRPTLKLKRQPVPGWQPRVISTGGSEIRPYHHSLQSRRVRGRLVAAQGGINRISMPVLDS